MAIQALATLVTNSHLGGLFSGKIVTAPYKGVCVPGLQCYSCPASQGACPIGAMQALFTSTTYQLSFYVVGFLMALGALIGRLVCGYVCPFGWLQDLLHKIPVPKIKKAPNGRAAKALRYGVLGVFVVGLPLITTATQLVGSPAFCQFVCPSGTLAGLTLMTAEPALLTQAGIVFGVKVAILALVVALCTTLYRAFCRYLCPLGAIYGLMNPVSLYRYRLNAHACTHCAKCEKACPMGVAPQKKPNSPACIRCGRCLDACPEGALSAGFGDGERAEGKAKPKGCFENRK